MLKRDLILYSIVLIIGSILFWGCSDATSPGLDDTFNVIQDVAPISGAQETFMNLQNNSSEESPFLINFSNIAPNNLINNGTKEAWCIEWGVDVKNGIQDGVKLYSTAGREGWKELNYFLTIKDQLKSQDQSLTWKEFQVVIWELVQYKPFDVDKIPEYQNFDTKFYENGTYKFDVQKVKSIVNQVKSGVAVQTKAKTSGYEIQETSGVTVTAVVVENDGQTVVVEGSETFWAYGTDYCFRSDDGSQWGWVYGFEYANSNPATTPLIAGAGDSVCPDDPTVGTTVGDVSFTKYVTSGDLSVDGDSLDIHFSTLDNNLIDILHIDADCDLEALKDRIINNGGNVAPGKFPITYGEENDDIYYSEVTFSLSLSENELTCTQDELFFAIHGVAGQQVE